MTNQSYTEDGGLAFPAYTYDTTLAGQVVRATDYGMTLRDYFAAKAMAGLMSQSHAGPKNPQHMGHGWGEDCANQLNNHQKAIAHTLASFA
jgi:hypothetical protein